MHRDLRVTGLPAGNETVKIGHTLRFNCNNDKLLDGPEHTQCLESGQWSSQFPTCAGVLTSNHRETTPFAHALILIQLGIFFRTEYCHAYRLPINVIASGNQIFPQTARPGKRLTFSCSRSGHFLQGAKEVECLATGQWSQPFPTCEGKPGRSVCACVCTCMNLAPRFLVFL